MPLLETLQGQVSVEKIAQTGLAVSFAPGQKVVSIKCFGRCSIVFPESVYLEKISLFYCRPSGR
jgi:hypothetical protein